MGSGDAAEDRGFHGSKARPWPWEPLPSAPAAPSQKAGQSPGMLQHPSYSPPPPTPPRSTVAPPSLRCGLQSRMDSFSAWPRICWVGSNFLA